MLTFITCAAFRGLRDILVRKVIPWPSLFGTDDQKLREDDIINRRRAWTWRWFFRWSLYFCGRHHDHLHDPDPRSTRWASAGSASSPRCWDTLVSAAHNPLFWIYALQLPFLFLANFLIFLGPLLLMGISQIKVFEPGDAEWGVKLDDVRGQTEAKEEIRRIITLWQSGEVFESAGGKRERGLIFYGAPGTGKTMMAKAIATGFNSPFITMPGLRLRADVHRHRRDHRALPRAQREEAGQEVGRPVHRLHRRDRRGRHAPPGARRRRVGPTRLPDTSRRRVVPQFYGQFGAVNPSGDLICESAGVARVAVPAARSGAAVPVPGLVPQGRAASSTRASSRAWAAWAAGSRSTSCSSTMDGVDNPPFEEASGRTRPTRSSTRSTSSRAASGSPGPS